MRKRLACACIAVTSWGQAAQPAHASDDGQATAAERLLIVLPTRGPRGVAVDALRRTIELYVQDALPIGDWGKLSGTPAEQREQALSLARTHNARWVLFTVWTEQEDALVRGQLEVILVDLGRTSDAEESFSLPYPKAPNADWYRLIGLKSASLVQIARTRPRELPAVPDRKGEPEPASHRVAPPTPASRTVGVEAGASGHAPMSFRTVTPSVTVGIMWMPKGWAIGVSGAVRGASTEANEFGSSTTSQQELAAGGRARLFSQNRWGLWVGAEAGVRRVSTSVTLLATNESRSATDVLPILHAEILGTFRLASSFDLVVGPRIAVLPIARVVAIRGHEVSSTEAIELGASARAQFRF